MLTELGLEDIAIVGIAKGPDRDAGRERFFMPGTPPFSLEPRDPVLYFLQRLRDEAHRFAIGTHRTRRAADLTRSALDEVPGIGAGRKRALLQSFRQRPCGGRRHARGHQGGAGHLRRDSPRKSMTTSGAVAKVHRPTMLFNLPNLLTLSRIAAIPLVVACFWLDRGWAQWLSMSLFVDRRHHRLVRRLFRAPLPPDLALRPLPRSDRRQAAGGGGAGDAGRQRHAARRQRARRADHPGARDPGLRPARVPGRAAGRPAGEPARQMEDRRPDGGDRRPAGGRRRLALVTPDRASC